MPETPFVPVLHARGYGALGDGTTDDTTAIQNAIDQARKQAIQDPNLLVNPLKPGGGYGMGGLFTVGGRVYIPAGTYICRTLTLYSNVHLVGDGIQTTILKLAPNANSALLKGANFDTLTGGNTTGGINSWSLQNLTLDGNSSNNSGSVPIVQVYGYGYILLNVRIRNGQQDGLYSEWSTSAGSVNPDSMEAQLTNFKVHDCTGAGITWKGPHDSQWHNGVVYNNSGNGIFIGSGGNALLAANVHSWGNSQTNAWFIDDTAVELVNCEGEGASVQQIIIRQNDVQIIGGQFFAAGGATTGITIGDGTHTGLSGITIVGTKVLNCTTASLKIAASADGGGNIFMLNVFQGSGAAVSGSISANSVASVTVTGGATGAVHGQL